MKTYREMADDVLSRRDEYEKRAASRIKKLTFSAVALLVSGVVAAAAIAGTKSVPGRAGASSSLPEPDKVHTDAEGKKIPLTVSDEKIDYEGKKEEKYISPEGDEYVFDGEGNLKHFMRNVEVYMVTVDEYAAGYFEHVGQEATLEIARKALSDNFGPSAGQAELTSTTDDDDGSYIYTFAEMMGKEKFIRGIRYCVTVLPDGNVFSMGVQMRDELRGFDESVLDPYTKEFIDKDAEEKMTERFGDDLISFSINDIGLVVHGGRLKLCVAVDPELKDPDQYSYLYLMDSRIIYYDLSSAAEKTEEP